MGTIYCIVCLKNNKKYIGKTKSRLKDRMKHHWSEGKNHKLQTRNQLYQDIDLYGREQFIYGVVEEGIPLSDLDKKERYWVEQYWGQNLYNLRKPSGCKDRKEYEKLWYQENKHKKDQYYQDRKELIKKRYDPEKRRERYLREKNQPKYTVDTSP